MKIEVINAFQGVMIQYQGDAKLQAIKLLGLLHQPGIKPRPHVFPCKATSAEYGHFEQNFPPSNFDGLQFCSLLMYSTSLERCNLILS